MASLVNLKNVTNERLKASVFDSLSSNILSNKITVFDLAVLVLSVFSIFVDFCTDLVLAVQYSYQGYKTWAMGTVFLIIFPTAVVQFFSLRWLVLENSACKLHWVLHICMLGILQRYIQVIKIAFSAFKSKSSSDIQKVFYEQNDLCLLHLFESFLESAPQLVLQLYVIAKLHEWKFWTGLSALASLLSLAWALAAYTKAQRRARGSKNFATWSGLVCQAVWRIGMLTSRIATLVLAAYSFGNYIFLIVTIHCLAMTVWIIYQKTDFCETYWEEKIYNVVTGIIYCFCFFNLQEGQSRWRALAFYLVIIFQNLICLTIFLMWFGEKSPELAAYGFIAVVGGIIFGSIGILLYYRFFHPSGPIRLFPSLEATTTENTPSYYSSMTLRSLKRIRRERQNDYQGKTTLQSDTKLNLNNTNNPSDSIIIVEENVLDDSDADIKKLQNWINEPNFISQASDTSRSETEETKEHTYKRRAICTSPQLIELHKAQTKPENTSLKLTNNEVFSEELSVHDYENLCSVNICREAWGLRSWRGYSDIETELHDDSVVYSRHLDTLTNTSSSSSNILQRESELTTQEENVFTVPNLVQLEPIMGLDHVTEKLSGDPLNAPYPGLLEPIYEETEESDVSGIELNDFKTRNGCASVLVATIEEIRMNTPIGNRHWLADGVAHRSPLSDLKTKLNTSRKRITLPLNLFLEHKTEAVVNINNAKLPQMQDEDTTIKPQMTNIKATEKLELKRNDDNVSPQNTAHLENKENSGLMISHKENIPTVVSKINYWNKMINAQNENNAPAKNICKKIYNTRKEYFC